MDSGSRLRVALVLFLAAACRRGPFPGDAHLDDSGRTPLMAAAMNGDAEAAKRAVAAGADLRRPWQDRDALHWAAWYGDAETVGALVDHGADCEGRDGVGDSPLELAIRSGDLATVQALLFRGARVERARSQPMIDASRRGSAELIELLASLGVPVDGRANVRSEIDAGGWTGLHVACESGNAASARALLDAGAATDSRTDAGWTPLHVAAGSGQVELVDLLLDRNADPRAIDALGRTPAHLAAELDRAALLRRLRVRLPAATWKQLAVAADRFGRTALHLAAWIGGRESVDVLLADSDRDARTDRLRWTAAHLAAVADQKALVGALMLENVEPPRDVLGRVPSDLLRDAERGATGAPVPHLWPVTPELPVVSWYREGAWALNRSFGQRVAVWEDGVVVRRRDAPSRELVVGLVTRERVTWMLDELRETGALERRAIDYCVPDGGTEELRVRSSDGVHEFAVWNGFVARVQGDFAEHLAGAECERAFRILSRLRADAEAPLTERSVAGEFRGISDERPRPRWARFAVSRR